MATYFFISTKNQINCMKCKHASKQTLNGEGFAFSKTKCKQRFPNAPIKKLFRVYAKNRESQTLNFASEKF